MATASRFALPPIQVPVRAPIAFQASGGSHGRKAKKATTTPNTTPMTPAVMTSSAVLPSRATALMSDERSIKARLAGRRYRAIAP